MLKHGIGVHMSQHLARMMCVTITQMLFRHSTILRSWKWF